MHLDLIDDEARALLNVLIEVIENDRYPMSPRIRALQAILAKCGEVGGLPPELAARLRRYAPPPPAHGRRQKERDPSRRPRQRRRIGRLARSKRSKRKSHRRRADAASTGANRERSR